MDVKNGAIFSGVAALVIAVAILAVSSISGVPVLSNLVNTTQVSQSATPGTFSVMLTDPPQVPAGVTAVFVTYANLGVHISEAGNESGWIKLSSGGTIDLLSTVNISQTIAAVAIPVGDYNALRLNVTSAKVTFEGKNYTSFVVNGKLFIPIAGGGIEVNDSKPSAAIIDISPLVMNIGSSSSPEFVIRPAAVAIPVPSSEVTEQMEHAGFRFGLVGRDWWDRLDQNATANLRITGASLSSSSLSVSVKDESRSTTISLVVVSSLGQSPGVFRERLPTMLRGTAVFVVEENGSLVPLHQFVTTVVPMGGDQALEDVREGLTSQGFNLTAGSTAAFSYTGQISMGFSLEKMIQGTVSPGQQYLVTVIGTDALASQVVVAT